MAKETTAFQPGSRVRESVRVCVSVPCSARLLVVGTYVLAQCGSVERKRERRHGFMKLTQFAAQIE